MEEILLRHRAMIDDAVHSLNETTPIEDFLSDLEARVAALRLQEPSFWELHVVEYIRSVVASELKASLRDGAAETGVVHVKETVHAHLHTQLQRLLERLERPEQQSNNPTEQEHFLDSFWEQTARLAAPTSDQNEETNADIFARDEDAPPEDASYEAITFDDLQFETGSTDSAPSPDEIPMILEALSRTPSEDRHAALQRLAQISPLELVHCSTLFVQIAEALCHQFLKPDPEIARQALHLLYSVVTLIEDPSQFLDLYFVVVDWIGARVSSKKLGIASGDLWSESDATIQAVDALRFFHLMMCRVPYHWIHFSVEMLVRVVCSTCIVLMLDPPANGNDQKAYRTIDVLAMIDPDAKWFAKWILKAPSRTQLFASFDETGFLSDLMYAMTRVRPFEIDVEPLERARTMNTLTILAISARSQAGQAILKGWTRLPAHLQHQRRYTEWLGLEKQFRLDAVSNENERRYSFHRTDCTMTSTHRMGLEDGGPLGDHTITAIVLSSIVIRLFNESTCESFQTCLRISCQSITLLPSHQEILTQLVEMLLQCGLDKSGTKIADTASGADELEALDPWFPFRRPKPIETVTKRASVFECLVGTAARLPRITPSFASAIPLGLHGYLDDAQEPEDNLRTSKVVMDLQQLFANTTTPFTIGTAINRTIPQLVAILQRTADQATHDAVLDLVLVFAQSSSSMSELIESGLWRKCQDRFLQDWQATGNLDNRILQRLLLPSATEVFLQSEGLQHALETIEQTCVLDLETAVALNAAPSEAPIHLRQFSRTIASLRAVLGTQYAARIFTARDTGLCKFLARSVSRHEQGACRATPQSEDLCTIAYELLTAACGCIPYMVAFYDLLTHCQASPADEGENHGISACSWLATNLSSSLAHVGGHESHWVRPQPLYHFSGDNDQKEADSKSSHTTGEFVFSSTTRSTLDEMMASIEDSKRQCTPLDMVMLSQATWEIIADVEKVDCRDASRYRTLSLAFGELIYALATSGQSKLEEEDQSPQERSVKPVVPPGFPTDAERKLMNTYYKDYCARLGLTATPTMLHVLSKVFGTAAMDCFSCTLLMILGQSCSEQETIAFLQYCATRPSIYLLWPRIVSLRSEHQVVPVLLPVAQAAEMILEVEFPQIFSTLRQCHCSVLTLVLRWHTQCYWNYLPWDNILLLVYLSFLYGVEFQVYFFVAAVKHFEPTIRTIIVRNYGDPARAFTETLQTPIEGFSFHTARNLFLTLRSTYHDRVHKMLSKP